MKQKFREYHSLRFFRGRKRNNAEMQRLADACMDFEYRRILIFENELDLHVYFSRMIIFKWLSWLFLALAVCRFQIPFLPTVLLGLAIISRSLAYRYMRKFRLVFRCYILALAVVDHVISNPS